MEAFLAFLHEFHTAAAIFIGFVLDLIIGDPVRLYHPVQLMGKAISFLDRHLNRPVRSERTRAAGGTLTACLLIGASYAIPFFLLDLLYRLAFPAGLAAEAFMCFQILSVKSLKDAALKVKTAVLQENLPLARRDVAMIVGRDTDALTEEGVIRAAVETVAENTVDGCICPLFYLSIGGPAMGFAYKAISTLDSMIGYKNEKYLSFGKAGAILDDIAAFLPARIGALLMIAAAFALGYDGRGACAIFKRDRKKSKSPNSAHCEAVCAGALGVRLGGPLSYFGVPVDKPWLGDGVRAIEAEDISRACRLELFSSLFMLVIAFAFSLLAGCRLSPPFP